MAERILAIIPIRRSDPEFSDTPVPLLDGRPLVEYTMLAAKEATLVDRVIVSTDSEAIAESCRSYGVEVPFIRPGGLAAPGATVTDVLLHSLLWLEEQAGFAADWVVKLEITHPFRPKDIVDTLIRTALARQVDSAILVREEASSFWTIDRAGAPCLVGQEGDLPRKQRRPFYRDASGLASITRAANLKAGRLLGANLGLIPFRDPFAIVDMHEGLSVPFEDGFGPRLAALLAPAYNTAVGRVNSARSR